MYVGFTTHTFMTSCMLVSQHTFIQNVIHFSKIIFILWSDSSLADTMFLTSLRHLIAFLISLSLYSIRQTICLFSKEIFMEHTHVWSGPVLHIAVHVFWNLSLGQIIGNNCWCLIRNWICNFFIDFYVKTTHYRFFEIGLSLWRLGIISKKRWNLISSSSVKLQLNLKASNLAETIPDAFSTQNI